MASNAPKLRIVKCPKCHRLLTEFSDVPVYTCGGCGVVLQAKNRQANNGNNALQMLASISSGKNLLQHVSDAEGSLNDMPPLLNRQAALFSTDANSTDIDHVGEHKHVAVPTEKTSSSDSQNSHHREKDSSEWTENPNMEADITGDSTTSTGQPETLGEDTISVASDQQGRTIQDNMDSFSDGKLDDSSKLGEHGSVYSCSSCENNVTEPLGEDTISVASDQQGRTIQVNMDSFSDGQLDDSSKLSEHGSVDSSSCCKNNVTETLGEDTVSVASDQQGRTILVNMDSFSDGHLDDYSKLIEHGSVDSSSGCKNNVTENSLASEDTLDADPENISCEKMNDPNATSVHANDGNESTCNGISHSHEQHLFLPSAVENKEVSHSNNAKENDGREDHLSENTDDFRPHVQSENLSSNSSGERCSSLATFGSSDLNPRSTNLAYYRENSRHSEIFHSARKELEDGSLSMSLSRDSSFRDLPQNSQNDSPSRLKKLENDRMELLRKVDELRNHLTRPYMQGREGNQRFHIQGTRQDSHWPFLCNHGYEPVPQCCNTNITQAHSRSFGRGATAQFYESLRVPFSGQGNSSCLHHHPKDWCIPVQLPPNIYCRACTPHVFCYPSTVSGPRCCKSCNAALCSHKSQTTGRHSEKLHCKEKRQPLKRHCRPVSGGAPFVICNNCVRLLQLPADFLVSKERYHKLKCGGCSEVIVFLSHCGGRIVPDSGTQLDPAPSEAERATEHARGRELAADRSCGGGLQGDPVSYSEEYGPPFSYGYSTDVDPAPHVLSSLQRDRRHGKHALGSPLHRLMGYDSATELIYQPSDEDEAYESRDLAHFYRTSNEIHFSGADARAGMGYPLQGHPEIGRSPEHTETHKDDGSAMRSTHPRGSSPLRGFFKKGIKELNHGLESMKLSHAGGRVIPAPQLPRSCRNGD